MTLKEMTEIFAVMKIAYPNAKMFEGGVASLKPTIELWTSCLADVDFWTGQQALLRMCRECKFQPTIADFREQADAVKAEIKRLTGEAIHHVRTFSTFRGMDRMYQELPDGNPIRLAIDAMGGVDQLVDQERQMWRWSEFEKAYTAVIRNSKQLTGSPIKALPGAGRSEKT